MYGYGQWAQRYRTQLWLGTLPLPPRAKKNPPGGYTGKTGKYPTDGKITNWIFDHPHGNICLRMPGDVLGIDVDAYPYDYVDDKGNRHQGVKTGDLVLAKLEAELGPLPLTWRSSSRGNGPSGIRFYRVPSGLLWGDFGEHLEGIWWGHRYAVVYPSINPDSGNRYLWIDETAPRPVWGADIPKVTDLPDLPDSWVAAFGRSKDEVARPPRQAQPDHDRIRPGFTGSVGGPRRFTRTQAQDYIAPHLDELRAAPTGAINNTLNRTAKVLSHFVPTFWSHTEATLLLWDALSATAYDARSWKAEDTIRSAFDSATGDWVAELVPEPPGWVAPAIPLAATTVIPRPTPPQDSPTEVPGSPPALTEPPGGHSDGGGGFWQRREILEHIDRYARSRYTAPWAVLGAVLARAIAAVEPNIQLPAIIGSPASLNLFVALVGPSGGGKDAAAGVAEHALTIHDGQSAVATETVPLGSGEGLSHIYMKPPAKTAVRKRGEPDEDSQAIGLGLQPDAPVQYRTRAVVTVAEIDTLTALAARQSATVSGQLRQAAMGDQLGFFYVDTAKRMLVPKHAYRLCLIAGVQPGRAQGLLAETDGGTPQRFLWLPATDPTMVREAPERPEPLLWTPPQYRGEQGLISVCQTACDVVLDAHIARQRGEGDALDGHALLTRLKIAAGLAMLDTGRDPRQQCTVTDEDWELSGLIMAVSDQTRHVVARHLSQVAQAENEKRAYAEARKTVIVSDEVEKAGMGKAIRWLRGKIGPDWITERELRQAMKNTIREHLAEALDRLVAAGELEAGEYGAGNNNATARRFRASGAQRDLR